MRKWFKRSDGVELHIGGETWVSTTLLLLRLHYMAIVMLVAASNLVHAESQKVYMDNGKSADAIAGVYQYCSESERDQLDRRYQIDSFEETDRSLGIVSPFKITTHIYSIDKSQGKVVGLTVYYAGPKEKRNCAALIMFSTSSPRIKIQSSYSGSQRLKELTPAQLELIEALKRRCVALGGRAQEYFNYGNYFFSEGANVIEDPVRFSCEAAAINNTSAINVQVKSMKLRITVIYDVVFIEGI